LQRNALSRLGIEYYNSREQKLKMRPTSLAIETDTAIRVNTGPEIISLLCDVLTCRYFIAFIFLYFKF